jgi:hypothetical protein
VEQAAVPDAAQMDQRDQPRDAQAERERRCAGHQGLEILAERHGGERNGCRETDRRRQPAGEKSNRRMVASGEVIVLAAGARKHPGEFAVGGDAAQRHDPAHDPKQQEREAGRDVLHLVAEAGEHPDADHVGHHDGGGRGRRNRRTECATRVCGCHDQAHAPIRCLL